MVNCVETRTISKAVPLITNQSVRLPANIKPICKLLFKTLLLDDFFSRTKSASSIRFPDASLRTNLINHECFQEISNHHKNWFQCDHQ